MSATATIRQAIEALEQEKAVPAYGGKKHLDAPIANLRALLADMEKAEPVADGCSNCTRQDCEVRDNSDFSFCKDHSLLHPTTDAKDAARYRVMSATGSTALSMDVAALRAELAASQAREAKLREAISCEASRQFCGSENDIDLWLKEALALPRDDTALRAYVAEELDRQAKEISTERVMVLSPTKMRTAEEEANAIRQALSHVGAVLRRRAKAIRVRRGA